MAPSAGRAGVNLGRTFETVAASYDEVRPRYPDELYALVASATGPLAGQRVLDVAAGSGIASRALHERGARVVAMDPGLPLLRRLQGHRLPIPLVAGVAEALPFATASFDIVCCATAWHWVDADVAVGQIRRVVRSGGHLAVWWANHRRDPSIAWEAAQAAVHDRWELKSGSRPPTARGVPPREAAAHLRDCGLQIVVDTELHWSRTVTRDMHLRVLGTHSDTLALGERAPQLLAEIDAALAPWDEVEERLWGPLVVARMP